MAIFKVFKHPLLGHEVIKEGFSWPGFLFTWIWAFVKKLWLQGGVLLIAIPSLNSMGFALLEGNALGVIVGLAFILVPSIIVGVQGNSWREKSMSVRGYVLIESVEAETSDGALAKINQTDTNK